MKIKFLKCLLVFMLMVTCTSFTSFATSINTQETTINKKATKEEKQEYRTQVTLLKEEIKKINQEIKILKTENTKYRSELKKITADYKVNKTLTISEENYKKALELKKSIPEENKEEIILDSETSIQTFVDNEDYNAALNKLSTNLDNKKKKLEIIKNTNVIWTQIHNLIINGTSNNS